MKAAEPMEYRKFTKPAELHKSINTLKGLVSGITTDRNISEDEINELSHWCMTHSDLIDRHPFSELIPFIKRIYQDGIVTASEADDIVWMCNSFVSNCDYYDLITSSLQFLQGLFYGIMADGEVSDSEILSLKNWVQANEFLSGCYPFDEIESLVLSILSDGKITDDERNLLKSFFSNFIDTTLSYNLNENDLSILRDKYSVKGICAVCQEIDFHDTMFCFTGQSEKGTRNEIAEIITSLGGKFNKSLTNHTRYLIVGNQGNPCWAYSCYGRKIEDAINRRKSGQNLTIINEIDFWDIVNDLI